MGHGHSISLSRKDIARKKVGRLQVLRLTEFGPASVGRGQGLLQVRVSIVICQFTVGIRRKIALELGRQLPSRQVGKEWAGRIPSVHTEEVRQVGLRLLLHTLHIRIKPLQKLRSKTRTGLPSPKAPDLGFLEYVIAAQQLVGAFAGEHNFETAAMNQVRKQEQKSRAGAQHRLLSVPDDLRKDPPDIAWRAANLAMLGTKMCAGLALEFAFVEFGVVKGNREGPQLVHDGSRERGDEAGIDAAAEICANGNVRPLPDARRVGH